MQIRIIKPAKKIQDHIQKITVFRTPKKIIYQQKITPSPFTCLSYNHFDIPKFQVNNSVTQPQHKIQLSGPKINDDIYALHQGKLNQVLIELKPSSFFYLFHKSPTELVNQVVSLEKLTRNTRIEKLSNELALNNNYQSHIKKLTEFLEELKPRAFAPIDYVEDAIHLIEKTSGNITVQSLCEQINKSERQFNRKFTEVIGIAPIQYIKIRQLHYIINLLQLKQHNSMMELAYDTGFYDPAHFANSFKKLTGMSPGAFIQSDKHFARDYFADLTQ